MRLACRLHGHRWQIVGIHIGQQIDDGEVVTRITWACARCEETRTDHVRDCWIAIDIAPERKLELAE
jgi:hypothetical protein